MSAADNRWGMRGAAGRSNAQDEFTPEELADLLGYEASCSALAPVAQPLGEVRSTEPRGEGQGGLCAAVPDTEAEPESIPDVGSDAPAIPVPQAPAMEHPEEDPDGMLESFADDLDFQEDWAEPESSVPSLDLTLDVPDVEFADQDEPTDFLPEVHGERRARQQAIAFLLAIGELNGCNVERIIEIILARRWSTAQGKVRELWNAGYSLGAIHLAFRVSEVWRESDAFDERAGQSIRGGWAQMCRPQLSWWEAMQLVAFRGENCGLEEIVEFIEAERHTWRRGSHLRHQFVRFKDYLLRERIADECRMPGGGWYRTLDPRDERYFDGATNPEYTTQWWEDEPPTFGGPQYLLRRIFMGEALGTLIVEPDDGLHWLED